MSRVFNYKKDSCYLDYEYENAEQHDYYYTDEVRRLTQAVLVEHNVITQEELTLIQHHEKVNDAYNAAVDRYDFTLDRLPRTEEIQLIYDRIYEWYEQFD